MAGGKLTPRQKMINLMYLVFIAMLALNMSKEVLSAFGILNTKIVESNAITDTRNNESYKQLASSAADQPGQYEEKRKKVEKIRAISGELNNYIEGLKKASTTKFDLNEEGVYEKMDKGEFFDELFFKGDETSPKGKEFVDKIKNFPQQIKDIGGSSIAEDEVKKIFNRFAAVPVKSKSAGTTVSWLEYNYHGFPLIASIAKLSQLQADIKTSESDVITGMFQSSLKKAASLTAYEPIVVLDKTAFFQGEAVTGRVILGKFDPTLKAKSVTLNGMSLQAESGQAKFSFSAGGVGEKDITGSFNFEEDGKLVPLPIKGNYVVVPKPNSATISADKMNVVYRGVINPMTVSFAGISGDKVKASGAGLSSGSKPGQYNMSPGQGTEVMITVTGTLPDGKSVADKKTFRIKNIPAPVGAIGGQMGIVKGQKSRLEVSQITAVLPDFDFLVTLNVVQFSLKVSGQPTVIVNGNRVNAQCKAALARAGRGDQVTISEIKTKLEGSSIILRQTAPVIYEIQ